MFWGKQIKIYERLKKLMGPGVGGGVNGSGSSIIGVVGKSLCDEGRPLQAIQTCCIFVHL